MAVLVRGHHCARPVGLAPDLAGRGWGRWRARGHTLHLVLIKDRGLWRALGVAACGPERPESQPDGPATSCPWPQHCPHPRASPKRHGGRQLGPWRSPETSGGAQPGPGSQGPQDGPSPTGTHLPGPACHSGSAHWGCGRSSGRAPRRVGSATCTGPQGCSSHRTGLRGQGWAQRARPSLGQEPASSKQPWRDGQGRELAQRLPCTPSLTQSSAFPPTGPPGYGPRGHGPRIPMGDQLGGPRGFSGVPPSGWGTQLAWLPSYTALWPGSNWAGQAGLC